MTVAIDAPFRSWSSHVIAAPTLEDKYEILNDIGDGSFGSVVLGRTRSGGAHIARKGTLLAIKTMKKTFESMAQCNALREVIFLNTLPDHPHLVPTYDIFLDPLSKKLHIAMEHMDGNLYQLIKARNHKPLDDASVKNILFQILSGLEHVHEHDFFHRDIKPENVLVSTSAADTGNAFKRYSALTTPPATPSTYTIKLADFGLARETNSRTPYTTYVSTRWYRAPEVLLRAAVYSCPVDIWALGAMAVEIVTLKPMFPGSNEVDQVWRVCEIMGSPGSWVNRRGVKVGGGDWKEGIKLAQKLGFSFPKMAPQSVEKLLPGAESPASLAHFITWCLMWDPDARPTSTQALAHEYFVDAVDPLMTNTSSSVKLLGLKTTAVEIDASPEWSHSLGKTKGPSWFRRSVSTKEMAPPAVPEHQPLSQSQLQRPVAIHANTIDASSSLGQRLGPAKRSTWNTGPRPHAAPIPILPSIKPVSPLPLAVNALAGAPCSRSDEQTPSKIGRQLSMNSHGNHYGDLHRPEAEKFNSGLGAPESPASGGKESFFSHLRKRARRFSGRNQAPVSPPDDIEASAGCATGSPARPLPHEPSPSNVSHPSEDPQFAEVDKALNAVRESLEAASHASNGQARQAYRVSSNPMGSHSASHAPENRLSPAPAASAPLSARTQRSARQPVRSSKRYETPDEEDELIDEAIASAHDATGRLDHPPQSGAFAYGLSSGKEISRPSITEVSSVHGYSDPYLTPSPSKDARGLDFGQPDSRASKPLDIIVTRPARDSHNPRWPTPPYEENEWAASAAASIYAAARASYH